jgi:hypothetical protein
MSYSSLVIILCSDLRVHPSECHKEYCISFTLVRFITAMVLHSFVYHVCVNWSWRTYEMHSVFLVKSGVSCRRRCVPAAGGRRRGGGPACGRPPRRRASARSPAEERRAGARSPPRRGGRGRRRKEEGRQGRMSRRAAALGTEMRGEDGRWHGWARRHRETTLHVCRGGAARRRGAAWCGEERRRRGRARRGRRAWFGGKRLSALGFIQNPTFCHGSY